MTENIDKAVSYYQAMLDKKLDIVESYLSHEVEFIGPIATMQGRDGVFEAAKRFADSLISLEIR